MRRLLLILGTVLFSLSDLCAQTAMWVGQSREFDATSAVIGMTTNVSWSTNGGYLSLSGSGFYRRVTVTQYFKGSATITCSWQYKLYSNDTYKSQQRSWTITCNDNPVSIHPTTLTLAPGQSSYLTYSHKYSNEYTSAANAYFSSDGGGGVITVSRDGKVTANKVGQAYVNVYSKISEVDPYCLVTVKEIDPTGVSIKEKLTLIEGESFTLTPTLYPSGASSSYSWSSNDPEIATVSSSGVVNAVKQGKTRIVVTTVKGGYTDYCDVTVKAPPVPPTSVSLPETVTLYNGFSTTLTPTLEPQIAETTYSWSSSDNSVVSVSNEGKITAKSIGQAEITVTTANQLTTSCTVIVSDVPDNIDSDELLRLITLLNNLSKATLNYVE